jgi:hypothetical protein
MSTLHFRNAKVEINGSDLSDHVSSVTLNYASEMLDETAMGDSTRIRKGGLKAWSIDITPHQDFASGKWDAILWPLVGTTVCVELRPQNICSTAVNPIWSGIGVVEKYNPVGGAVGTLLDAPTTIQSAGDLARNTSAT